MYVYVSASWNAFVLAFFVETEYQSVCFLRAGTAFRCLSFLSVCYFRFDFVLLCALFAKCVRACQAVCIDICGQTGRVHSERLTLHLNLVNISFCASKTLNRWLIACYFHLLTLISQLELELLLLSRFFIEIFTRNHAVFYKRFRKQRAQ